jgi:diketogulonate reductase-like aldo/keto reductase
VVGDWLAAGGRAIDTSADYGDGLHYAEGQTGAALKRTKVPRAELFITTKIPQSHLGFNSTLAVAEGSLQALGLDHVDLLLIHWPGVHGHPTADPTKSRQDTWRALEQLHRAGKVRAIGVSNFMPNHLAEIFAIATIPIAVNQFEYHVGVHDQALLELCGKHNITVTSYAPLACLDEGILQFSLPYSILYRKSLYDKQMAVTNDSAPSYIHTGGRRRADERRREGGRGGAPGQDRGAGGAYDAFGEIGTIFGSLNGKR